MFLICKVGLKILCASFKQKLSNLEIIVHQKKSGKGRLFWTVKPELNLMGVLASKGGQPCPLNRTMS